MIKILKILGITILALLLLAAGALGLFIYDMGPGFDTFDTEPPELPEDIGPNSILVFSKTNGFRHGASIEASIPVYRKLAQQNGWSIYETENAGVFNREQLSKFKLVIWNNATGRVLTDEQRVVFKSYLLSGGGFLGVHGAGDGSHQWDWYEDEVIKARFSHHNIGRELEFAQMNMEQDTLYPKLYQNLPNQIDHQDEWYVFFNNPREAGAKIVYTVDENTFNTSGNLWFLVTDKDFGMGDDHPIVWYHELEKGRVFYSALGHHAAAFESPFYQQLLENAIRWTGRFD